MIAINPDFTTRNIYNTTFTPQKRCRTNISNKKDDITFSGVLIRPLKNKKEISELAGLFFESYNNNLPHYNIFTALLDWTAAKIASLPFWYKLNKPDCYTEAIFNNKKMAGGYSFKINRKKSTGHIEFMTLADEFKRTKFGISALKSMTGRICQKAAENNIKEITWLVNIANLPARRLFGRFNAEKISDLDIEGNMKYKISFEEFKRVFEELSKNC